MIRVSQYFGILYTLLVIGQVILCNYNPFGPYVTLTLLPAMIMCIPTGIGTIMTMFIAFISGLSVDWLADGILGLNAAAALPLALLRNTILKAFLGEDLVNRHAPFSFRKNGITQITVVLATFTTIFLTFYIILDGAGTLETWFCFVKGILSLICNLILGAIVVNILSPDERK